MLFKSLQLTFRNLRGITRVIHVEHSLDFQLKNYSRFAPRAHKAIVNEDELFDVEYKANPTPKTIKPKNRKYQNKQVKLSKSVTDNLNLENEDTYVDQNEFNKVKVNSKYHETEKLVSLVFY